MNSKENMSDSGKKFLEKINQKELKENNELKDKDNQIKKATPSLQDNKVNNIIKKEENKNNTEANKGQSIFERMKMFNNPNTNDNNQKSNKNN